MRKSYLYLLAMLLFFDLTQAADDPFAPASHLDLQKSIRYPDMVSQLEQWGKDSRFSVFIIGKSVENRALYALRFQNQSEPAWRVLFYAQQHGDEPAGKDALLYLAKYLYEGKLTVPQHVDLYLIPMLNPDGAEANRRTNGNRADLNRDHLLLEQPETQALHLFVQKILPHVAVDCHEFGRDGQSFASRGWIKWPIIMLDAANYPFLSPEVLNAGSRHIGLVDYFMNHRGHPYTRYYVGGVPPEEEIRHSTTELNDGRNGLALYGGLSFIIESGRFGRAENPDSDLAARVDAYLDLLSTFLQHDPYREENIKNIDNSRTESLPPFIPVNCFWGNCGNRPSRIKVLEQASGKELEIETPNFMGDLIVKKTVPTPKGYLIAAADFKPYQSLLQRHAVPHHNLTTKDTFMVEKCQLLRIETEDDPVYERYGGRQIVERKRAEQMTFPAGALWVPLEGKAARRAALILEPCMLYGLYQYDAFRATVLSDGIVPVYRVMEDKMQK